MVHCQVVALAIGGSASRSHKFSISHILILIPCTQKFLTMSSNTFISFDWRSAPNTNDTISAIIKLLTEADSSGLVNMRLSQSTAADVVSLQERDGTPMVRRREYIVRLACTDALQWLIKLQSRRKVDNQVAYWAKLWQQVRTLQSMMVNQQQVKMRAIQYKHADPTARSNSWALRQVKQRVEDLALSLGVHPAAFGVLQEDSGTVHIPERIKIEIVKITDIHLYNNRDRTKKWLDRSFAIRSVLQLGEPQIPQLVESLALRFERGHRVDAVVVLEHRNVTEILGEHQYGLKDVLIVMVSLDCSNAVVSFCLLTLALTCFRRQGSLRSPRGNSSTCSPKPRSSREFPSST